jgi:two-component system LytT family response regulator
MLEFRNKSSDPKPGFLFLKSGFGQVKVFLSTILFIESAGNYLVFTLENDKLIVRLTMKEVVQLLPEQDFLRVHRSFIVAKRKVSKIERQQLRLGKHIIPVGSMYAEEVLICFSIPPP